MLPKADAPLRPRRETWCNDYHGGSFHFYALFFHRIVFAAEGNIPSATTSGRRPGRGSWHPGARPASHQRTVYHVGNGRHGWGYLFVVTECSARHFSSVRRRFVSGGPQFPDPPPGMAEGVALCAVVKFPLEEGVAHPVQYTHRFCVGSVRLWSESSGLPEIAERLSGGSPKSGGSRSQ